jgi:LPS-assembly lipoprotein
MPRRFRAAHRLALPLLLALLSACGYHLRGQGASGGRGAAGTLDLQHVFLRDEGAPLLATAVKEQLSLSHIQLVDQPAAAEVILVLSGEQKTRRMHTVDPGTGKVREYQLIHSARMSVLDPKGGALLTDHAVSTRHEYTFDEQAVLGKSSEEAVLGKEMANEVASAVIFKLGAVRRNQPRQGKPAIQGEGDRDPDAPRPARDPGPGRALDLRSGVTPPAPAGH